MAGGRSVASGRRWVTSTPTRRGSEGETSGACSSGSSRAATAAPGDYLLRPSNVAGMAQRRQGQSAQCRPSQGACPTDPGCPRRTECGRDRDWHGLDRDRSHGLRIRQAGDINRRVGAARARALPRTAVAASAAASTPRRPGWRGTAPEVSSKTSISSSSIRRTRWRRRCRRSGSGRMPCTQEGPSPFTITAIQSIRASQKRSRSSGSAVRNPTCCSFGESRLSGPASA